MNQVNESKVAKPNVDGRELVTCEEHHTRRMAKFCTPVPVYNADHEIVSYVFRCKEDQICSSALQRAKRQNDPNTNNERTIADNSNVEDNKKREEPVIYNGASSTLIAKHSHRTKTLANNSITSTAGEYDVSNKTYFSVTFTKSKLDSNNANDTIILTENNKIEDKIDVGKAHSQLQPNNNNNNKNSVTTIDTTNKVENEDSSSENDESANSDIEHNEDEEQQQQQVNNKQRNEGKEHMNDELNVKTEEQRTCSPPPPAAAAAAGANVKGPVRYYDLIQRAMAGGNLNGRVNSNNNNNNNNNRYNCKHMCWLCGLTGHEKPECPNMLCRTCHSPRPSRQMHHICTVPQLSPFIFPPNSLPEQSADGMAAIRCLFCGKFGHFDCHDPFSSHANDTVVGKSQTGICNTVNTNNSADILFPHDTTDTSRYYKTNVNELSCCFCGRCGHTTFTCNEREHVNPDRWIQRMQYASSAYNNRSNNYNNNNNYYYYYYNYNNNNGSMINNINNNITNTNSGRYNNNYFRRDGNTTDSYRHNTWREQRVDDTHSNKFYNNGNSWSNNNNNYNNNNNIITDNRGQYQSVSVNNNYDRNASLSGLRSQLRSNDTRKRFRSNNTEDENNDRYQRHGINNDNNNNNNNNDEDVDNDDVYAEQGKDDESEHAQWLKRFRDGATSSEKSFPPREFNINRRQYKSVNYTRKSNNNYSNNNNNTTNNTNRNAQYRNAYTNREIRQDYSNQRIFNRNSNNNNNNNNNNRFNNNQNQNYSGSNNQRRDGRFQDNANMSRRRRAKPHEYDSDEDDLY